MLRTAFSRATAAQRFALVARNASTSAPATTPAPVSLGNIEASWKSLTPTEQEQTFKHLEELQKKDWKELSLDEKKAAYYVAFGPHGPREPIQADGGKTFIGVTAAVAVAGLIFYMVRKGGKETPATLTREWQEATDERLREQRSDPFTGVSAKNGASQVSA